MDNGNRDEAARLAFMDNETRALTLPSLGDEDRTCSICMQEYFHSEGDADSEGPMQIRRCGHVFGQTCLLRWLTTSSSCPMCRTELFPVRGTPQISRAVSPPAEPLMFPFTPPATTAAEYIANMRVVFIQQLRDLVTLVDYVFITDRSMHRIRELCANHSDTIPQDIRGLRSFHIGHWLDKARSPSSMNNRYWEGDDHMEYVLGLTMALHRDGPSLDQLAKLAGDAVRDHLIGSLSARPEGLTEMGRQVVTVGVSGLFDHLGEMYIRVVLARKSKMLDDARRRRGG